MKIRNAVIMILLFLLIPGCYKPTGCYGPMTGTVVDAETGKPIEGAVVHVEWTVTTGVPGLQSTKTYDVVEKVTDKEGTFRFWGVLNPIVNRPLIIVYKKGYVAWRSDYIFPDYEHRKGFGWKRRNEFSLNKFTREFSHSQHISFIRTSISINSSSKLEQVLAWEYPFASKEEDLCRKKMHKFKPGESNKKLWEEVVSELYGNQGKEAMK